MLPPDLQLHLGPYGGRHTNGGVVTHMEVQSATARGPRLGGPSCHVQCALHELVVHAEHNVHFRRRRVSCRCKQPTMPYVQAWQPSHLSGKAILLQHAGCYTLYIHMLSRRDLSIA